LRYFHQSEEEEEQARAIASKVKELGVNLKITQIKGYETMALRSFEIWLGRE
jgi:hypothetical protein